MAETLWLVDSSGWIEYFTDGPNASCFAPAIEQPKSLVVPSLSLLEVYRWMLRRHGEGPAIQAIALMRQGHRNSSGCRAGSAGSPTGSAVEAAAR